MNTIIRVHEFVFKCIYAVFSVIGMLFDAIDLVVSRVSEIIEELIVDDWQRMELKDYKQMEWNMLHATRVILFAVYPLFGVIFLIVRKSLEDRIQEKIFYFNRVIMLIMIIWGILNPTFIWGHQMEDWSKTLLVNYLIAFNPVRAVFSLAYFNIVYINSDFLRQKPSEWVIDQDKKKSSIEEYDEYGNR